uniref:Uncharacterized protein n=1 Tax=Pararge aegeria TaxID=116150 RepID=S4PXV5_9NEOP
MTRRTRPTKRTRPRRTCGSGEAPSPTTTRRCGTTARPAADSPTTRTRALTDACGRASVISYYTLFEDFCSASFSKSTHTTLRTHDYMLQILRHNRYSP